MYFVCLILGGLGWFITWFIGRAGLVERTKAFMAIHYISIVIFVIGCLGLFA